MATHSWCCTLACSWFILSVINVFEGDWSSEESCLRMVTSKYATILGVKSTTKPWCSPLVDLLRTVGTTNGRKSSWCFFLEWVKDAGRDKLERNWFMGDWSPRPAEVNFLIRGVRPFFFIQVSTPFELLNLEDDTLEHLGGNGESARRQRSPVPTWPVNWITVPWAGIPLALHLSPPIFNWNERKGAKGADVKVFASILLGRHASNNMLTS